MNYRKYHINIFIRNVIHIVYIYFFIDHNNNYAAKAISYSYLITSYN